MTEKMYMTNEEVAKLYVIDHSGVYHFANWDYGLIKKLPQKEQVTKTEMLSSGARPCKPRTEGFLIYFYRSTDQHIGAEGDDL